MAADETSCCPVSCLQSSSQSRQVTFIKATPQRPSHSFQPAATAEPRAVHPSISASSPLCQTSDTSPPKLQLSLHPRPRFTTPPPTGMANLNSSRRPPRVAQVDKTRHFAFGEGGLGCPPASRVCSGSPLLLSFPSPFATSYRGALYSMSDRPFGGVWRSLLGWGDPPWRRRRRIVMVSWSPWAVSSGGREEFCKAIGLFGVD